MLGDFPKTNDNSFARPLANIVFGTAAAQQQAYGPQQNRFTRPGFAGYNVQPGGEIDFEFFNNGKILNFESLQHSNELP
jgi:hypothetical protein